MRIALVVTSVGNVGSRGMYNRQEVGLARGLAALGHEVEVLQAVPRGQSPQMEFLTDHCLLREMPVFRIGSHGWYDRRLLERFKPDGVVMFSDLQLSMPSLAGWCRSNGVAFLPFVGTLHSTKKRRRVFETFCRWRNVRALRNGPALAKSGEIAEELRREGVLETTVINVGLDSRDTPEHGDGARARGRTEFQLNDVPVVGFVGRMEAHKEPLRLPALLSALRRENQSWELALVGDGPLSQELGAIFQRENLSSRVSWKRRLPNNEMWKLYCAADVMVNLCRIEIFGMSVIEAMHCGTPVVAVSAPGPKHIIRDGIDGYVCGFETEDIRLRILQAYSRRKELGMAARERIKESFNWDVSAKIVAERLRVLARPPG
ncbi:MAG: glycosyltransferase family 4 protein [Planctomycetia bacterium]|nr:glycosyltransferase family 4 protein [Planctomycetia bacterium]